MMSSLVQSVTVAALVVAAGCSLPTGPAPQQAAPTAVPATATLQRVDVGPDAWIPLPLASLTLQGTTTGIATPAGAILWKKVSGPASFSIQNPQAHRTEITNLEVGTYEFEFSVPTKSGAVSDTIRVHVYEPRPLQANELVLPNLIWTCPMGCSSTLADVPVAGRTPTRVLAKKTGESVWLEVIPESDRAPFERYAYRLDGNRFWIFAHDEAGTVDVWIVF